MQSGEVGVGLPLPGVPQGECGTRGRQAVPLHFAQFDHDVVAALVPMSANLRPSRDCRRVAKRCHSEPVFWAKNPRISLDSRLHELPGSFAPRKCLGLRMTAFEASSAQRFKLALMGLVPALPVGRAEFGAPTAPWAPIFRTLRGLQVVHSRLEIVLDIGYRIS